MEILIIARKEGGPLRHLFQNEGYSVHAADSEREAVSCLAERPVHLVVLEGTSLCRSLRRRSAKLVASVPMLVIADGTSASEIAAAYEQGADGYLTKPYVPAELMARARALLRRVPKTSSDLRVWRLGGLCVDTLSYEVRCAGARVRLTLSEFRVLSRLISQQGKVVSRDELRKLLPARNVRDRSQSRIVDIHIAGIRRKLGEYGGLLQTVRGAGYRMRGR